MTGKDLFREVGNINEKYVIEAEETKKSIIHNVAFRRGLGTAACLVLCVGIFAISRMGEKVANAPADTVQNDVAVSWDGASNKESEKTDYWQEFTNSFTENDREAAAESVGSCPQDSASEDMMSAVPEMNEQEKISYDYENVVDRLQSYSNVYEELLETEAFIVSHGKIKNGLGIWYQFLGETQDGIPSSVDLIEFTEEGDAIITGIVYDGENYHVVRDCTRDAWGKNEILEYEYEFLYADTQDGCTTVILSERKLVGEEIREAIMMDGLGVHHLVEYME